MNFQLPSIGKQEESFQGRELSEAGFLRAGRACIDFGGGSGQLWEEKPSTELCGRAMS